MQSTDIAEQAVAILASVAASGVSVAQGVATRIIGDLISERLDRDGYAHAWNEFLKDPQNDSLVRHLLGEAIQQDRNFREEIETALEAAANETQGVATQHAVNITGSRAVQVGNRGDSIIGERVATRGATYQEGNIRNKNILKKGGGAAVVVLIVLIVVVLGMKISGSLLNSPKDGGLTASSTCRQFLNADQETQRRALADIGISEGFSGYSNPLAYLEFDTRCGSVPNAKIGALMKRDGNP